MSLESFQDRFPTNQVELKRIFSEKRKVRADQSPIAMLARGLVEEGAYGLADSLRSISNTDVVFEPDINTFNRLSPLDRQEAVINYSAIICGAAMLSLEQTMVDGKLDVGYFTEELNMGISKTPLKKSGVEGNQIIDLDFDKELKPIYNMASRDRSFATFFRTEGLNTIPHAVRAVIISSGSVLPIQTKVLPLIEERAKLLLEE